MPSRLVRDRMGPVDAYLLVLFASAITSYVLTPVVLKLSRRMGAVDVPDDRKVHAVPTPTLGGVAIFAAFVVGLAMASALGVFRS
ncbi:MAG: UDP-GlcNAc:undecaprenyl-phosphate/decaprenyl-phosphate GlcNAc-phosphate transferase, partial [Actinomycetota bacterium]|nr:UDP-GlcNAc:undecaprenyl-phosphate/decaprenyl-phosphate GlcNAc-phosphate transferase [Actinomycetota bacterium]